MVVGASSIKGTVCFSHLTMAPRPDSAVRILYAQPASPVSARQKANVAQTAQYRTCVGLSASARNWRPPSPCRVPGWGRSSEPERTAIRRARKRTKVARLARVSAHAGSGSAPAPLPFPSVDVARCSRALPHEYHLHAYGIGRPVGCALGADMRTDARRRNDGRQQRRVVK